MFNFGITKTIFTISFCFIVIFFITNIIRQYRSGEAFKFSHLFSFKYKTSIIIIFIVILLLLIGSINYFFTDRNDPQYNEKLFHDIDHIIGELDRKQQIPKNLLIKYEQMLIREQQRLDKLLKTRDKYTKKKNEIKENIKKINESLATLREQKNQLTTEKAQKELELKTKQSEADSKRKYLEALQADYNNTTDSELKTKLAADIVQTRKELIQIEKDIIGKKGEIDALDIKIKATKGKIKTKKNELSEQKEKLEEIKIKIQNNESQIKTVTDIIDEIKAEKASLNALINDMEDRKKYLHKLKEEMGSALSEYNTYRAKNAFNAGFVLKCLTQIGNIVTDIIPQTKIAKVAGSTVVKAMDATSKIASLSKTAMRADAIKQISKARNQEFLGRVVKRGFKMFHTHQLLTDDNGCLKMLDQESYNLIMKNINDDMEEFDKAIEKAKEKYQSLCNRINNNEDIQKVNEAIANQGLYHIPLASAIVKGQDEVTTLKTDKAALKVDKNIKEKDIEYLVLCRKQLNKKLTELQNLQRQLNDPELNTERKNIITNQIVTKQAEIRQVIANYFKNLQRST